MKQYINILVAFIGALLFNGCTDDSLIKNNEDVIEGIPTTLTMSFASEEAEQVSTKSALPTSEEYSVKNMYVFVFKQQNNEWVTEKVVDTYNVTSNKVDDSTVTAGTVSLPITSGAKRIYAVANAKNNTSMPVSGIANVQTLNDLNNLVAVMNSVTVERGQGNLIMSGVFETTGSSVKDGSIIIFPTDDGKTINSGKIWLNHINSKIKFNVTCASGITFQPKEWRVVNVPLKSYVVERPFSATDRTYDAVGYETEADYGNTSYVNFNSTKFDANQKAVGGDFTFYMLENRKNYKSTTNGDYQCREKQAKNPLNGDYIYAEKYATYVEMTGSYFEDGNEEGKKSAEVKYTIHLGYVNSDANDFKSERAKDYTYNANITGVDKIELEVTDGDEQQPGAEGDVVKSTEYFYLDSHYEVLTITFNKNSVDENNAKYIVNSPYGGADIQWVKFALNNKKQVATKYKYYDLQNTKNLGYRASEVTGIVSGFPNEVITTKDVTASQTSWKYYKYLNRQTLSDASNVYDEAFIVYPGDGSNKLYTIDQILVALKDDNGTLGGQSVYDDNGNAVFTVFVDEYYYDGKPFTDFINAKNREMHILCDTKYSSDKESSLTTSNFLISQRSIKTFYDLSQVQSAWGVETLRENNRLSFTGDINPSSPSNTNGRWNMYNYLAYTNASWATYINPANNWLQTNYQKVKYACLQRNRDLNGNGTIEDNEVRWYLPAKNQLAGMWLGRDGFSSTEVYLFKDDPATVTQSRSQYHFQNSNGEMFWAEEGMATGSNENGNMDYRCVRNIGQYDKDTPVKTQEPQGYVQYNSSTRVFDMSRMNSKAIRPDKFTSEMAVTTETNQANRPYKKFKVAANITNGTITQAQIFNGSVTPCATYSEVGEAAGTWRMPNQRELAFIMAYAYPSANSPKYVVSRTRSALSLIKSNTQTGSVFYQHLNSIMTLAEGETNTQFYVRCVKDID